MCDAHLNQLIWSVLKFDCTSNNDTDFIFPFLQKRLCKSCLLHYLRIHYTMYPFVIFQKYSFLITSILTKNVRKT